jgi:hypothetical protein
MKILAIVDVAEGAEIDRVRKEIVPELRAMWELHARGVVREAYATATPTRVVFVLEAADTEAAREHFRRLPMVAGGLVTVAFVELLPFVNWAMLFAKS